MEPSKNPDYLQKLIVRVGEFQAAYQAWLNHHIITDSEVALGTAGLLAGVSPAVMRREGVDDEVLRAAAAAVSRAAGRIVEVPGLTNTMIGVQGLGAVDPFANALYVARPKPPLEARDVLQACESAIGRLEGMLEAAQAAAPPAGDPAALHPLIWGAAGGLWRDGHRRLAVYAAADALVAAVKARTGRSDVGDTTLWRETFSEDDPQPGRPRLRWPGDPNDLTVKSIRAGLRQFAPGVQMLVRNPVAHTDEEPLEQVALELLSIWSYLARTIDGCKLIEATTPSTRPANDGSAEPAT